MDAKQMGMSPIDLRELLGQRISGYTSRGLEPPPILLLAFARLDQEVKADEARLAGVDDAVRWRWDWESSRRQAA